MSHALLLDLDDTLLHNSMDDFLPHYFRALTEAMAPYMAAEPFLRAVHHATQQMMENTDPRHTNEAIFWQTFEPLMTVDRATLDPVFTHFYDKVFPTLFGTTERMTGAQALLEAARAAGWKVAVATNPVFPKIAIQHRIEWAGLDESLVDLITSYENMYSTKPHTSYFEQIARMLEVPPERCVMAGNQLANDLVGAAALGMRTFWVTTYPVADAKFVPDGEGSLEELRRWLFDGHGA